jgi:LmbE family N-acetylglucosaminyl deacetylase
MCITAHPDDESGAFAGALMRAHARGAQTSVICLTDGRAASHRGNANGDEELGQLRRQEFAAALRVLNVSEGKVLDYPDGKLAQQNFSAVAAVLVEWVRRLRPQVVLTFGGDGSVNQHPDHVMTSFFATAAFHWAGQKSFPGETAARLAPYRPQKLYYSAAPFLLANPEEAGKVARVTSSLVLDVSDLKGTKYEAFRQHATQAPILARAGVTFEKYSGEERYLLVAARGGRHELRETDMFAGIEED